MPTTKLKNAAYRFLLPFCSPSCDENPISSVSGHNLICKRSFLSLMRKHHVLGSAVMLCSGDQRSVICTSSRTPMHMADCHTFFRVASITKTATSVLCLHLADMNILDPDRPVSEYFSDAEARSVLAGITLRHLLSHTSGLSDPSDLETSLENSVPFTKILPASRTSPPGDSFRYSNLGFGIIGCLLESVLGLPVGEIYQKYLFSPLNMNATLEGCLLPRESIMPVTRVLPYRQNHDLVLTPLGSKPLLSADPLCHYGHTAGSMYTDIQSLQVLFDVLIRNGNSFLSRQAVSEITKEHASYGRVSPTLSYGLGLLRINDHSISDRMIYGHQGFAYGCADGAFWEADTENSVIILNGGSSEARKGRLGLLNRDMMRWAFQKELPSW